MPFNSIAEIEDANQRAGYHWFEPATRRFFKSRVLDGVHGGCFFSTSEQGPSGPRMYSVHYATDNGAIHKASAFQTFGTATQAHSAARRYAVGKDRKRFYIARDGWGGVVWTLGTPYFRQVNHDEIQDPFAALTLFNSPALATDFTLFYQHDVCRALNIIYEASGRGNTPNPDMLLAEIARTADHVRRNG